MLMPQWLDHYYCLPAMQGQKEALLLSVSLKCFAHLKAGVVLWLPSIYKMPSSFPVSGEVFMDREDFLEGKGCFIQWDRRGWMRPVKRKGWWWGRNPAQSSYCSMQTAACACVAVLMVVGGLPIFLSADLGLQVPFPCTQCNFLSQCLVPFKPEACRVEWHCWGCAQPWCIWVKCSVHPAVGDGSLFHVAAGSHIHGFLRCLIACTTDCVREQSTLSNMSDSFNGCKLCPGPASCFLKDSPGSPCIFCARVHADSCTQNKRVFPVKEPFLGIWD